MGSSCLLRRSWTQASRILARATRVEAWGAAVAVGEKVGARMVAKARNATAARREQGNSGDLAGGVEGTFMAAPINRNLLFDFKRGADVTPIPLFADSVGWDRLLNWRVAHSKWLALAQVAGYGLREPAPRDFARGASRNLAVAIHRSPC